MSSSSSLAASSIVEIVHIDFLLLLFLFLVSKAVVIEVHVVIIILGSLLLIRQGFIQVIKVVQTLSPPLLFLLLFRSKGFEVDVINIDIILRLFVENHFLLLLLHWRNLFLSSLSSSFLLLLSISLRVKGSLLLFLFLLGQIEGGIILSHPDLFLFHSLVEVNQAIK